MSTGDFMAIIGQIWRYSILGILNNLLSYLIYLVLTLFWLDPKVALTIMYPIAAAIGYFGHSKYTFTYNGHNSHGLARYVIAHLIGYWTNIGMLYLFWNRLGYPHQLVQAVAIVVVAGVLFLLYRYFVFSERFQSS